MYIARQLSFHGVTFDIREVTISEKFREMFDASVELVSGQYRYMLSVHYMHHSGWRLIGCSMKQPSHWIGIEQDSKECGHSFGLRISASSSTSALRPKCLRP